MPADGSPDGAGKRESIALTQFSDLGLAEILLRALNREGYETPTSIQTQAIPHLMQGRDLLGIAQTGTGKTAAFALPLLHTLLGNAKPQRGKVCGLVLVPTRELAMQVAEALHKYAKGSHLHVVPVYGGAPMDHQIRALRRGADVVDEVLIRRGVVPTGGLVAN